jgi:hypothetical protein
MKKKGLRIKSNVKAGRLTLDVSRVNFLRIEQMEVNVRTGVKMPFYRQFGY